MYFLSSRVLIENSKVVETNDTLGNVQQVADELSYQLQEMHSNASDWSNWDDLYRFMSDRNKPFIDSNLATINLNLDTMAFLDPQGNVFYSRQLRRPGHGEPPDAQELRAALGFVPGRISRLKSNMDVAGLLGLPSGPVLVSVRPIVKTSGKGPPRGWTVFALRLDRIEINRLSERTHISIDIRDFDNRVLPSDCREALSKLRASGSAYAVPLDEHTIAGYSLLFNLFREPIRLLRVENRRDIYAQGLASQHYLIQFIVLAGIIFGIVIVAVLEIATLSRVSKLSLQVEKIEAQEEDEGLVSLPGKDELSWLARKINGMVISLREGKLKLQRQNESLEQANQELAASNHALANAVEGIVEVDQFGQITTFNSSFAEMHGFGDAELAGFHWRTLIVPEDHENISDTTSEAHEMGKARCEVRGRKRDGSVFHEEVTIVRALDSDAAAPCHWFTRDVTERWELEAQIKHQAFHDTLTGLPNRALFVDRLRSACQRSRRRQQTLAVLFMDLNDFKAINDSMGHEAGDRLLEKVADRIQGCLRDEDTVARMGGDEFTILLESVAGTSEVIAVAERIINSLKSPISLPTGKAFASTSIGIAVSSNGEHDAEQLLHHSDLAMYYAKDKCKLCYAVYTPEMGAPVVERKELAQSLKEALAAGRLSFRYQPLVDLNTGKATGIEAFLRWHDESRGDISPELIISIAEESGLMDGVGTWAFAEGCRQMKTWIDRVPEAKELAIHVNLTGRQLLHTDIASTVRSALVASNLPPDRLVIEVSARSITDEPESSLGRLKDLKTTGVRLALDDFGTGTHLISKLSEYPFDIVKIDGTVTWMLEGQEEARAIAQAILIMANSANAQVVAEGIETLAQLHYLREMGCTQGQGYVFSRPLTSDELVEQIQSGTFIPAIIEKSSPEVAA